MGYYSFIQANGLDERFNQTLQNTLRKYIQENKESWDTFLDTCNTFRHESTLRTPFEVMFGRKAVIPIDLDVEKPNAAQLLQEREEASVDQPGTTIGELTSHRMKVLQQAKNNIAQAQKKQKEQYDWKHANPPCYSVGAKVLKKDFTRKKRNGGKMDHNGLGPIQLPESWAKDSSKWNHMTTPTMLS